MALIVLNITIILYDQKYFLVGQSNSVVENKAFCPIPFLYPSQGSKIRQIQKKKNHPMFIGMKLSQIKYQTSNINDSRWEA